MVFSTGEERREERKEGRRGKEGDGLRKKGRGGREFVGERNRGEREIEGEGEKMKTVNQTREARVTVLAEMINNDSNSNYWPISDC